MDTSNCVNPTRALEEWNQLVRAICDFGNSVSFIEPIPGAPDMTFSSDCGLVHRGKFLRGNFKHPERQVESAYYEQWFTQQGYEIFHLPSPITFEGMGDVNVFGDELIFAHGQRTSPEALPFVESFFTGIRRIGTLTLHDPRFYHLGLALARLSSDTVIFSPLAFDEKSNSWLRETFADAIALSEEDALMNFACNCLVFDKNVLIPGCSSILRSQLESLGFRIWEIPMNEFRRSGAGPRCLVLDL